MTEAVIFYLTSVPSSDFNNVVYLSFIAWCNSIFAAHIAYLQLRSCKADNVTLVRPSVGRKHGCNWNPVDSRHHHNGSISLLFITHLPHSNNSISDEDKKDDEGFHKGGDGLLTFLKPGQHLRSGW